MLCIHQSRANLRLRTLSALPEIIASSSRLTVLLSPTIFSELLSIAEVATFCAAHGLADGTPSAARVDFTPLWKPPWLLVNLVLEIAASLCTPLLLPLATATVGERVVRWPHGGGLSERSVGSSGMPVLSHVASLAAATLVARAPLVLYNAWTMSAALRAHEKVLQSMHMSHACLQSHTPARAALGRAACADAAERRLVWTMLADLAARIVPAAAHVVSAPSGEVTAGGGAAQFGVPTAGHATPGGAADNAAGGSGAADGGGGGALGGPDGGLANCTSYCAGSGGGGGGGGGDDGGGETDAEPASASSRGDAQLQERAARLEPWLQRSLWPCLAKRLGQPCMPSLPLALLVALPATYVSALEALGSRQWPWVSPTTPVAALVGVTDGAARGQVGAAGRAVIQAVGLPSKDGWLEGSHACSPFVHLAILPLTLLCSSLPLPLTFAFVDAVRRALRRCSSCCYGSDHERLGRCAELIAALAASALAHVLASVVALALPVALLGQTCGCAEAGNSAATARFCASLGALIALHSLFFASTHPRGVLLLAALAVGIGIGTFEANADGCRRGPV